MARILLFLFSFIVTFAVHAQGVVRQQGYVRSVGRPENKAGKRLPGAVIKVTGQHNTVRSGQNGKFTLEFNGMREGKDSYSFASVRLTGYDLPENGMLGRRYPLSSTVPVEVVLVPQTLKIEIEEKVRRTVETQYRKKLQRIEALRAKDVERYRTELQRLEAEYEKRDQLITDMVERYASTDYAHLDSLSARINQYIEAGELERADSLINTQDLSRLESEHAALQSRTDQLRTDLAQSESATAASLRQLMSLYEGKRDIHIARFENDSAAMYWEKIVQLDTTNVRNVLGAGTFIEDFMADYNKAMSLFQMALYNASRMYDESHRTVAACYNNIGSVYARQGEYSMAMKFYDKALSIRLKIYGENHPDVADSYNNIGFVHSEKEEYSKAIENYAKSLSIRQKVYGENHPDVAAVYVNIGYIYAEIGEYFKSMEYFTKSLSILSNTCGENHRFVAACYNNIGSVYADQGEYSKAMENYAKSLSIRLKIYGENHPDVAACYNNIGSIYFDQGENSNAIENYAKALSILQKMYGDNHPDMAYYYHNIGSAYHKQKEYSKALENYTKSLSISQLIHSGNYSDVAMIYGNTYLCYSRLYAQSPLEWQSKYESFIASHMAIATVVPNGAAAQKGMDGTYYMLEFGDWQTGSTSTFMDEKDRLAGKPKTVVFYRDGKFIKEHFDDQIGVQLGVKSVDKAERESIIKAWKKWRGE